MMFAPVLLTAMIGVSMSGGSTVGPSTLPAVTDPTILESACFCIGTGTITDSETVTIPAVDAADGVRVLTMAWGAGSTNCVDTTSGPRVAMDTVDMDPVSNTDNYTSTTGNGICGKVQSEVGVAAGSVDLDAQGGTVTGDEWAWCYLVIQEPSARNVILADNTSDMGKGAAGTNSGINNGDIPAQTGGEFGLIITNKRNTETASVSNSFVFDIDQTCSPESVHTATKVYVGSSDVVPQTSWTTATEQVSWYGQW